MAFSRKKIEERKAWLRGFVPGTYLDHTASDITYTDFVNKVWSLTQYACLPDHTCFQPSDRDHTTHVLGSINW